MERLLVGDLREDLVSTLEVILKHWGFRVLASSDEENIARALEHSETALLIAGEGILDATSPRLKESLDRILQSPAPALIALDPPPARPLPGSAARLAVPVDLFRLFELVQYFRKTCPRRHLRLDVKLPGMIYHDQQSHLAEVISISSHGLFIKTTFRMERNDSFRVVIPLFGMRQELDLAGRVVYRMEPAAENNYRQGVGIEFADIDERNRRTLEDYLEKVLLGNLAETRRGSNIDPRQIQMHSPETLELFKTA